MTGQLLQILEIGAGIVAIYALLLAGLFVVNRFSDRD